MNKLLIPLGLLSLSLFVGVVVVWPQFQNLQLLQKQKEAKATELANREHYLQNLASIAQQLKDAAPAVAKIEAALPKDPQLPAFYDFIQQASATSGLALKAFATSPAATQTSKVRTTQSALTVTGSYAALKNFLSVLQTSSRISEVESISFATPLEGDRFTFTIRLNTFSY